MFSALMRLLKKILKIIIDSSVFIPYKIIDLLITHKKSSDSGKDILILKLDEIGDYILFRNFLPFIRQADIFKGHKIILCGNIEWKQLAEAYDSQYIDEFIWINKKLFTLNPIYRLRILKKINSLSLHTIINYSHSRKFYLDDSIVKVSFAQQKYGNVGDLSNMYIWQKKLSDKYYSRLIDTELDRFEFYKNRSFTEEITGEKTNLTKPFFDKIQPFPLVKLQKYIVISPGARFKHKRWSEYKFAMTAKYLSPEFTIVLTGGKNDKKYVTNFQKICQGFYDLTGRTSLPELISLINSAELVICNDSAVVHIAAALNTRCFVIHNGTHFGRFLPYPEEMNIPQVVIHPQEIELISQQERKKAFYYRSHLNINSISVEKVTGAIKKILEQPEK